MFKNGTQIEPSTIALYKLLTVLAFIVNILLVLMKEGTTRVDIGIVQVITVVFVGCALFISFRQKDAHRLNQWLLMLSALFLFTQSAFVYELTSPILVLNSVVIVVAALLLPALRSALVSVVVMLGPVLGYILTNDPNINLYLGLLMHIAALVALSATATIYGRLRVDELESSKLETVEQTTERKRLEALINSMTDGVIATDREGLVTIYNGSALDILNLNASLDGKFINNFLSIIDEKDEPVDIVAKALSQGGYLVTRDLRLNIDENDKMNLFINISPVKVGFGSEGKEGLIMLLRDITREKSLEEERNEFISVVSHELRTPITITEGNVSNAMMVAKKENASELIQNMLDDAHKQVVFLADMMNDLSTLSRAERGKLQVQPEEINVHELIEGLQHDYRGSAEAKGLKLLIHVSKDVGSLFNSKLYVREVLQNFLTNSIKYTQKGEVKLSATMDGETFTFAVTDTGIGISVSDQKMLFKKFFRSEDFRTRENSGTGLGLYVTMKLAKLIGASIKVESEINKGSTFTIAIDSLSKDDQDTNVSSMN